jgi:hypothetical protein
MDAKGLPTQRKEARQGQKLVTKLGIGKLGGLTGNGRRVGRRRREVAQTFKPHFQTPGRHSPLELGMGRVW